MSTKKSKKSLDTFAAKLSLAIRSGKYCLGTKSTLKALRDGSALVVIIANNCPPVQRSQIEYYANMAKAHVHIFRGNNNELGAACGKSFRTSVLAITDVGDSDILSTFA